MTTEECTRLMKAMSLDETSHIKQAVFREVISLLEKQEQELQRLSKAHERLSKGVRAFNVNLPVEFEEVLYEDL